MIDIKIDDANSSRNSEEVVGVIRSAIVLGPSEKHYDIIFARNGIRIVYLGEYKYTRLRRFLGKNAELQIYRVLRNKRRAMHDHVIEISGKDIVSIRIEKPRSTNMNKSRMARKDKLGNLVLLEIMTRSNKYSFYINAKIYQIAKKIVNKYIKNMQQA